MAKAGKASDSGLLWWMRPQGLVLGFLLPIFLMIMLLGGVDSPALTIRGVRFLDLGYGLIGVAYLVLIALAAHIGGHIELESHGPISERGWLTPATVLGLLSLVAYCIWFKGFAMNPGIILQMLQSAGSMSREDISTAVGVTSLSNLTPVFFCLVAHVWANEPAKVPWYIKVLVGLLLFLTVFRVYVWAERLALIEVLMAAGLPVVWAWVRRSQSSAVRGWLKLLPILGLPALLLYFGMAEYYRAWQADTYQAGNLSFWEFASGRLASYYYTSLNNGVGMLETQVWPTYRMENVLQFLHKAPLLVGPIFQYYIEADAEVFGEFLKGYGDPEFNNPSGIYAAVYDLGYGGAAVYFVLVGFAAGVLSRAFARGQLRGVLLYPFFMVTMLELYRYPYLGTSRAFTISLGVIMAGLLMYLRFSPRSLRQSTAAV